MRKPPRSVDRRSFLGSLVAASAFSPLLGACATGRTRLARPNIVLIMCDDLGFADVGFSGATAYRTPGIDRIAREGMVLGQSYSAAPVCSPTRVALMTGRYPARDAAGLYEPLTTHPTGLPASPVTLPRLLKDAGYRTALVGKWHLGLLPEYHPLRHGFDEFYGFLGGAADYVSKVDTEARVPLFHDGETPIVPEGYLTDLFSERAERFIGAAEAPFFLSLQYNAPHWPWQGPADPAYPDGLDHREGGTPERFAAMMQSLDEGVARVLRALDARGIAESTLVVFTSDNGGERFSHMGPLSHGKMTLFEGGVRVATAARWPGVITAGSVSEQPNITMDWTETFLELAGQTTPRASDGVSLLPALRGGAPTTRSFGWRITQRREQRALRHGDLKLIVDSTGTHLFDLSVDAGETRDLAAVEPERTRDLLQRLAAWEAQLLPPVPLEARFR